MSKTNFRKDKAKDKTQAIHLEKKESTTSKDEADKISLFGDKKEGGRGLLRKESGKLSSINDSARKSGVFRFFHKDKKRNGKDETENPELPEVVNNRKVILPEETQHVLSQQKTLTLPVQNSDSHKRWSSYEPLGRNQWEPITTSIPIPTVLTSNRSLSEESLTLTTNPNINNQYALSTTNLPDITMQKNKLNIPPLEPSAIPILDGKTQPNITNQNESAEDDLKDKINVLDNKISKAFHERSDILKKICTSLKSDNSENEVVLQKVDKKFKVALGETFESLDVLNNYIIQNLLVSSQPSKEMASTNKGNLGDIVNQLSLNIHQLNDIFNDNSLPKVGKSLNSMSINNPDSLLETESHFNRHKPIDENCTEKSNLGSLDTYSSSETLIDSSTPKITDIERKSSLPDISLNIKENIFCPMSLDPVNDEVCFVNQSTIETDLNKGAKSPNSRILNVCSLPSISEDKDELFDASKSPTWDKNQREETVFGSSIVLKIDDASQKVAVSNFGDMFSSDQKIDLLLGNDLLVKSTSNNNLIISQNFSVESNDRDSLDILNSTEHVCDNNNILTNDVNSSILFIDHSSIEEGSSECDEFNKKTLNTQVINCPLSYNNSFKNNISHVIVREIINGILKDLCCEINVLGSDLDNSSDGNLEYGTARSNCDSKMQFGVDNGEEIFSDNDFSFADDKILLETRLENNLSIDNADSDVERHHNELQDLISKNLNYDPRDEFTDSLPSFINSGLLGRECKGAEAIYCLIKDVNEGIYCRNEDVNDSDIKDTEGIYCRSGDVNDSDIKDTEGIYCRSRDDNDSDINIVPALVCDTQIPISIKNDLTIMKLNENANIQSIIASNQVNTNNKNDINESKAVDIVDAKNGGLMSANDNKVVLSPQNLSTLSDSINSNDSLVSGLDNSLLSSDDNIESICQTPNNVSITSGNNHPCTSISDINLNIDFSSCKDLSDRELLVSVVSDCNSSADNVQIKDNIVFNGLLNPVHINCYTTDISNNQKRKKYRLRLCVDTAALRSWIVH